MRWQPRVRPSLALQLVLLVAAVTVLVGVLVGFIATQSARAALREEVLDSNLATADLAAAYTDAYMQEQQQVVRQFAGRPSLRAAVADGRSGSVGNELEQWLQLHARFDDVYIVDLSGACRASGLPSVGCRADIGAADRTWFEGLLTSGEPGLAEARLSLVTHQPVVWYGVPMYDPQRQANGVLIGSVSLSTLADTLLRSKPDPSARAALVDRERGMILLHPDPTRILERTTGQNEAGRRLRAGERGALENVTSRGEATLAAFAPLPDLKWGVLVQEPSNVAFAPVEAMAERSAVTIALATLLAGLAGVGLALWLTRPLTRLRQTADALAHGELSRRVGSQRQDEIGDLGRAFDHMASQLDQSLTELRESEAKHRLLADAVERERATLASVMESMTDGLVVLDSAGRVMYANDRAGRLLETEPRALVANSADELLAILSRSVPDPTATRTAWQLARARPDEQPSFEVVVAGPPRRDLQVQCFPVADGKNRRMGVLLHDITPERELVRAKDELTSMVSHELASPANNLVAYAELLAAQDGSTPDRRDMLAAMVHEGQRLTTIIRDFLDVKRLEQGRLPMSPRPTDLRPLLEQAAVAARTDKHHPLVLDVPDSLPLVQADAGRVQQMLANLLSNAQKYTPAGGEVRLIARRQASAVEVSVADRGLGIPAEALPRLFEKFYRVESADRRTIKGTGLGLAILKELVDAHGGQIGVESDGPGTGSRFWFTLPLASVSALPSLTPVEPPAREAQPTPAPTRLRVLAVDDDPMVRTAVTRLLRMDGHHACTVASAEEALERIGAESFNLVLSDLSLGSGMDGYGLARQVRRDWPQVRFVLASGSAGIDANEARANGVHALLGKPYHADEMRRVLTEVTSNSEREAA